MVYAKSISLKSVATSPLCVGKENLKEIICRILHTKGPLISLGIQLKHHPCIWRRCSEKNLLTQNLNFTFRVQRVDHMSPETIIFKTKI